MPAHTISIPTPRRPRRLFIVRLSPIHGKGVFAAVEIPEGTRIIEYTGERISHDEANARYSSTNGASLVLLFTVDKTTVIDAAIGGNEARFINHSCTPNCRAIKEDGRIFIEARRRIAPGEELTYDYRLEVNASERKHAAILYPCACGSARCRGTLIAPKQKRKRR
ncbi:MAG TPA: SET domain-containing protein-lysine N-methyltransferase [Methylomirabilota bacterium]|jgi:SET domain-containing protein|nr:SET domain-containing protein-lysine N-methyltransferase [Methylomirabilota bacterium]